MGLSDKGVAEIKGQENLPEIVSGVLLEEDKSRGLYIAAGGHHIGARWLTGKVLPPPDEWSEYQRGVVEGFVGVARASAAGFRFAREVSAEEVS